MVPMMWMSPSGMVPVDLVSLDLYLIACLASYPSCYILYIFISAEVNLFLSLQNYQSSPNQCYKAEYPEIEEHRYRYIP